MGLFYVFFTMVDNPSLLCNLCSDNHFIKLHEWDVSNPWNPATIPIAVFRCTNCGLAFLHPVPNSEQLPGSGDWWKQSSSKPKRRRAWFKKYWEPFRHHVFGSGERRLIQKTRSLCSSGRLLDIGCGTGELLEEAKPYFDCYGIEPSPIASEIAKKRGFSIQESTLEKAEYPFLFDVITLNSVIEHVSNPTAVLKKINTLLKPGGIIVMLTPKFDGPSYRRHRAAWNGFRHGYHTFLYSSKTLSALLKKTGYEVLSHPKRDRMFDDILILWGKKRVNH